MKWLKKNTPWLLSVLLMLMTITIFGPLELYFTNSSELWFGLDEVIKVALIQTLILGAVLFGVGFLLKGKVRRIYGSVIFAVAVMLYIQGNYANINYGALDGTAIDWNAYPLYAVLDTLGWVLFLAATIFASIRWKKVFRKVQKYGALFIIAIQIISIGVLCLTTDVLGEDESKHYLSTEHLYEIGEKDNVVIFVLDSFDEEYLKEIIAAEPEKYSNLFRDFVHFDNAAAGGASTKVAVPIIITGDHYPGRISYSDYIAKEFNADGLYSLLKKKDYNVSMYTESAFVPPDVGNFVDNQVSTGYTVSSYAGLTAKYAKLTLYKYMPHLLKQYFWLYSNDFNDYRTGTSAANYKEDDAQFYKDLVQQKLSIGKDPNSFKLYHFKGAHPPYNMNEKAESVSADQTSILQQATGCLVIVEEYINQMKALGVYDSSMIVVMADHGRLDPAHGILLVKDREASGEMADSSAPVSYYDLHNTIFSYLGQDKGDTFFDIEENDQRTRYFYNNRTESGKMKVIEYVINGHMDAEGSRKATGVVLMPDVDTSNYEYGTNLTFGADNSALPFISYGVDSIDMRNFSWTNGHEAAFEFPLAENPQSNLAVTLDIMTVYKKVSPQIVRIYANEVLCYEDILSSGKKVNFVVPGTAVTDEVLKLRIEIPNAVCPAKVFGPGNDSRTLGLAFRGLVINQTEEPASEVISAKYDFGAVLTFGPNATSKPYVVSGISNSSTDGYAWTSKKKAEFALLVKTEKDMKAVLDVMRIYDKYGDQGVSIYADDTLCFEGVLTKGKKIKFTIPAEVAADGILSIRLELPDAVCPKDHGASDARSLALALRSLTITEAD